MVLGCRCDRQHRPRSSTGAGLDVVIAAGVDVPRGTSSMAAVDPDMQRHVTPSGYSRSAPPPGGDRPTVPRGTPIFTGDASRWSERSTTDSADPVEALGRWPEKGGVHGPRPLSASRCRRKVDVGAHLSRLSCGQTSMPMSGARAAAERMRCRQRSALTSERCAAVRYPCRHGYFAPRVDLSTVVGSAPSMVRASRISGALMRNFRSTFCAGSISPATLRPLRITS